MRERQRPPPDALPRHGDAPGSPTAQGVVCAPRSDVAPPHTKVVTVFVILFGPPGSGKGTQASFITRTLAVPHLSTGDVLRAAVAAGGALGREVRSVMIAGRLVPDELIVRVVEERLGEPDAREGVVLDGFPRTVTQAKTLDTILGAAGRRVDLVVFLAVPMDTLVQRLLGRASDQGRSDDTADVIRERMAQYEENTADVLEHYRARGVFIADVDGVGSVEQVRDRIHARLVAAADGLRGVTLTGHVDRAPTASTT